MTRVRSVIVASPPRPGTCGSQPARFVRHPAHSTCCHTRFLKTPSRPRPNTSECGYGGAGCAITMIAKTALERAGIRGYAPTSALGGVAGSLIACHDVTEVSPHPIGRVARVQRPAIKADIRPKTTQLDEALRAVVTRFAERLERTEPELVDVAMVRFDVIADCRRGYDAALEAKLTKRMLQQLVLPDPRPAPGAVPSVPFVGWPRTPIILSPLGAPLRHSSAKETCRQPIRRTWRHYPVRIPALRRPIARA
jgi:hypothetical protein